MRQDDCINGHPAVTADTVRTAPECAEFGRTRVSHAKPNAATPAGAARAGIS
jgi:hypothetical protein